MAIPFYFKTVLVDENIHVFKAPIFTDDVRRLDVMSFHFFAVVDDGDFERCMERLDAIYQAHLINYIAVATARKGSLTIVVDDAAEGLPAPAERAIEEILSCGPSDGDCWGLNIEAKIYHDNAWSKKLLEACELIDKASGRRARTIASAAQCGRDKYVTTLMREAHEGLDI